MTKRITTANNPIKLLSKQHNYFRLFKSIWIIVFLVSMLTWQCKKENAPVGISGICPVVTLTDPANNAINVITNKRLSVIFNEPMNIATITAATFMLKDGLSVIGGSITDSANVAVFIPTTALKANTVYTAIVTTGVKDVVKNALTGDYVWSFTTGN